MKAMILAAGNGTRLQPITNNKPKALVEIKGIPLLEIIIKRLIKFGFNDVIINVHHLAYQIREFLIYHNNFGINIQISDETGQLLETGGGILHAKWFLNDGNPFLIYNVDILTDLDLSDLIDYHTVNKPLATLAVKKRITTRHLLFDEHSNLCEWRNVQTGEEKRSRVPFGKLEPLAFSGIHIISPEIFELVVERGIFSIMDVYLRLAGNHSIKGYNHSHTKWFEMGRYEQVMNFNKNNNLDFLK
jgi:NDP-sugar pyrophosphorylase family protein